MSVIPITKFLKLISKDNVENRQPNRRSKTHKKRNNIRSKGKRPTSPIVIDSSPSPPPSLPPTPHHCPAPATPLLTSLKDDQFFAKFNKSYQLDQSKLPSYLRDPKHIDSSSSENSETDMLLTPVNFNKPQATIKVERESDDAMEVNVSEVNVHLPPSPLSPSSRSFSSLSLSSPSHNSKKIMPPLIIQKDLSSLDYDIKPPYLNDLNRLLSYHCIHPPAFIKETQVNVKLFTEGQTQTLRTLLEQPFVSACGRIFEAIEYLMTITSNHCMPDPDSLISLWKVVMEQHKEAVMDVVIHQVICYFQFVLSLHPPRENEMVYTQYNILIKSIRHSFINVLIESDVKWKIDLISVITSLLLCDYHCYYSMQSSSINGLPLFYSLFWDVNGGRFINRCIRQLVQLFVDLCKVETHTYTTIKKLEIISQLLFLIYSECDGVSDDLSHHIPSLSPCQIFTFLSSLSPTKLQVSLIKSQLFLDYSRDLYITNHSANIIKLQLLVNHHAQMIHL